MWFLGFLGTRSQVWKEKMEIARREDVKKNTFANIAWQIYVDILKGKPDEYLTAEVPSCAGKTPSKKNMGSVRNAIRSSMPGMEPIEAAAEELVDTVLRIEVSENRIPAEACRPVEHDAWYTHGEVP